MAMHEANDDLHEQCRDEARARGLGLTTFRTNTGGKGSGYTRYTVYTGDRRPHSSQARTVEHYEDAPHQKHWRPSIIGEARALRALLATITG